MKKMQPYMTATNTGELMLHRQKLFVEAVKKEMGLNAKEMARLCGFSPSVLSNLKAGTQGLGGVMLKIQKTTGFIFNPDPTGPVVLNQLASFTDTEIEAAIIEVYKAYSTIGKRELIEGAELAKSVTDFLKKKAAEHKQATPPQGNSLVVPPTPVPVAPPHHESTTA